MHVPLVVDLDGALIRTDLLLESGLALLATSPARAFGTLAERRNGRAAFKRRIADQAMLDVESLPVDMQVLNFIRKEREKGRPIYLFSDSDPGFVQKIADHIGVFDGVFGPDCENGLSGAAKADRLCAEFGAGQFDYIGPASEDPSIWRGARKLLVVNASEKQIGNIRTRIPDAQTIGDRHYGWMDYIRAIRLHQWLKNILVFVPAIAAHDIIDSLTTCILAFLSFSFCASSVYIFNDLLDLSNDRKHPRKKNRPFAAGRIPIIQGLVLFPLFLVASLVLCLFLQPAFFLVLVCYYVLTCAYSFYFKKKILVDVVVLACLYGSRIWAGAAATSLLLSPWLITFSVFIFLCLALVKRCAELIDRAEKGTGDPVGRDYRLDDLPALQAMAAASGYVSVLVMALYLNSDAVRSLYARPDILWGLCILLLYWISRTLLMTHRGDMHDDPVVFAVTDRVSQFSILAGLCIIVAAV